jgi:hypothetical protein
LGFGANFSYSDLALGAYTITNQANLNECVTVQYSTDNSTFYNDDSIAVVLTDEVPLGDVYLKYDSSACGSVSSDGSIWANGALGSIAVPYGGSAMITWNSVNTGSCTITPDSWTGTSNLVGENTGPLEETTTYTMTCQP